MTLVTTTYTEDRRFCFEWKAVWNPDLPLVAWCLLNPSKEVKPGLGTSGNLMQRVSKDANYGGFYCVNLVPRVETKSEALGKLDDIHHSENNSYLRRTAERFESVVCGWGDVARPDWVSNAIATFERLELRCIGINATGSPTHPAARRVKGTPRLRTATYHDGRFDFA